MKQNYYLPLMIVTAMLAACGGGGSGSSSSPVTSTTTETPDSSTAGNVSGDKMFVDITVASGIQFDYGFINPTPLSMPENFSGGVAAGDYDGDGDIDLFIVRGDIGPNLLYRNEGDNTFVDVAASANVANSKSATENYRHSGPAFADMDGDGDLDLFIGGIEGDPSKVYANNGDGTFSDVTAGSGIDTMSSRFSISAAFGDYDLDGDLDMFVAHWGTARTVGSPLDTEHLWKNESNAIDGIRYTSVSVSAGISPSIIVNSSGVLGDNHDYTFTPTFADINNDRYPDLLVVGDFLTSQVFINNQDGTFTNTTSSSEINDRNGMGSAVGDFDSDGDLDWFVTGIWGPGEVVGNRLYENNNAVFTDITFDADVADGSWGWGACFADFDLDGDLDIYHTNGWVDTDALDDWETDRSRLFVSNGAGVFTEQAQALGVDDSQQGRGVVCADFDNDGDIDIFVTHRRKTTAVSIYRNDNNDNNYLAINLVGGAKNTEAAGARISVTIGSAVQIREVMIGSNFISQNPTTQIFGLGSNAQVDNVEIIWPDGTVSHYDNIAANQTLSYSEP
ncbi:CRTAC1 family protein [Oceanicoccus sp. KOV_DT_Chl]|uniref:CRTAC1 family protein n=1 Tax=Oceanicoccus sp. KOV_DT_Chl TaxID=1904639 RepID=UPI000C7CD97A|nr:CRTAC1 family protein [Oceanicoccus sp. KOV_DT_Chl]